MAGPWKRVVCLAFAFSAGLLLSACNLVTTEAPLFTAADAAPTPPLREGVWVGGKDKDCRFDEKRPVSSWPKCANWFLARGDTLSHYDADKKAWEYATLRNGRVSTFEDGQWKEEGGFLLVAGDPLIGQVGVEKPDQPKEYLYLGLRPTLDDQGRVIQMSAWFVQCGPPPPPAKDGEKPAFATQAPFAGMTMVENNCTTSSQDALRAAARASEGLDTTIPAARWLRDGDK
ncbi:hypothetical protein [Caulobacter sp. 17J65-9]|uniref:hypothetical protein n=1 Tax=Caulobacter sp. 17J65-9 TaxID=2709382 RepID=UPI0013C73028|nr:hypothetical protein [Caulobacter sp. 17J65-9]NEX93451.1 hypothetical protein [Caulobacter sp. 17J65-9]